MPSVTAGDGSIPFEVRADHSRLLADALKA